MQIDDNPSTLLDSLKCPITHQLFCDPVIGADGHTYERKNIIAWIQRNASSPITREHMDLKSLRPNYIVKKMVDEFLSLSLEKHYKFHLDVDVCKTKQQPIFQTPNKIIYEAKWMQKLGPPIVLIKINGTRAKREASFYVQLSCHPHIVRTYGFIDSDSSASIMLVQEYAPGGDLSKLLRNANFQPTFEVLLEIFWQIVDAMICLADNEIVHGDLACRNVLVFRSSSNQPMEILVKLTDFGLTRASPLFSVYETTASSTTVMIPVRHAAPEILYDASSNNYSEKSDVYSFGVLMWEVCSGGAVPYGDLRRSDTVYHERIKGKLLEQPNTCPNELWSIIVNCTEQESHKRPNFKAIREDLLRLRFQNKEQICNRTVRTQIDNIYQNVTKSTFSTNNIPQEIDHQYYNPEPFPENGDCKRLTDVGCYQNLDISSNEYRRSHPSNPNQSLSQYYIPCEYCLQSINTEDFDRHKEICTVQRLIRSSAKAAAKLPPLEITSCINCENMIPLNMFHIHKNTCDGSSDFLDNTSPISLQNPTTGSYQTMTYLKPVLPPYSQTPENIYQNTAMINLPVQNPTPIVDRQSEISNQSSMQNEFETITSTKPPKTGIRKTLSKLKHKILP
ncbi:unnamed protein product [Rotaria socialis]|uniref:Uncharacterized protein n=1 Tax=Rotaria socialis TaxID=392032 RepID=A0A817PVT5_9BILA|nr:unnamed protein product [Rotaria socialis]CAF3375194.1 unnamed protein product [Rotaria socialis]CAF3708506.1 unnamed protein product [Rotaria socialis]